MKATKFITLAFVAIICLTQFSCKKKNDEEPAPAPTAKKYMPTSMVEQNGTTAATIQTISYTYNTSSAISGMTQSFTTGNTIAWVLNYNQNGTLNTASYTNSNNSTNNALYSLSYDANNRLSRVIKSSSTNDTLNLNYLAVTNTYVGSGGIFGGVSLALNAAGEMDNMQDWVFGIDVNLVYQSAEKGIFADVNLDESVIVFLNIYDSYQLNKSFFHGKQLSSNTYGTSTYNFQNYNRNANGYIASYALNGGSTPRSYTVTYAEQ